MTCTGDQEIRSIYGRLADNPGELAYMLFALQHALNNLVDQMWSTFEQVFQDL